jgi:hypothetical protein
MNLYCLMLQPTRVAVARRAGVALDTRTRYEVIRDLRREGMDAYPVITAPVLLEGLESLWPIQIGGRPVLPLGGISSKTRVFDNESGQWAVYNSDEHGFRKPREIWTLPKLDVAVIGDSFIHGCCVPSGKDFACGASNLSEDSELGDGGERATTGVGRGRGVSTNGKTENHFVGIL